MKNKIEVIYNQSTFAKLSFINNMDSGHHIKLIKSVRWEMLTDSFGIISLSRYSVKDRSDITRWWRISYDKTKSINTCKKEVINKIVKELMDGTFNVDKYCMTEEEDSF